MNDDKMFRHGFTMIESIVVLIIIGVMIALLLPTLQSAREAARQLRCKGNLRQLGIAAHGYHYNHNEFPAESYYDGTPSYTEEKDEADIDTNHVSYRVRLLPFLGQAVIQDLLELTPKSGNTEDLSMQAVPMFLCPSCPKRNADSGNSRWLASHYYGIAGAIGKDTSGVQFPTDPLQTRLVVEVNSESAGKIVTGNVVLGPYANNGTIIIGGGVLIESITDGTSNTLLFGEIAWNGYGAHRNWVRGTAVTHRWGYLPGGGKIEFPYTPIISAKGVAENFPINIGKQQQNVVQDFVVPNSDPPELMPVIAPVRGRGAGHGIAGFGSEHVGGASFCYVDGSVHFLNESAATSVLMGLASRNGSETVSP